MDKDKFGRRAEDEGQESPMVLLARIDENIRFLKAGAEFVRIQLNEHEKQDDVKFKEIGEKLWNHAKWIYIGIGIVGVLEVLVRR